MKLKTTAIALAVAGIAATPMAAQADLYASARIGIASVDNKGVDEITVGGVSSRFGMRSETDLGNGMTGFGRYEFSVDTESTSGTVGNRHAYVGLKGDFGSVTLGRTYHTFYNHVVGPLDIPWVGSGVAMVSYTGRTSEALTYAGSAGAVSYGATLYFNEDFQEAKPAVPSDIGATPIELGSEATEESGDEGLDGVEIGASFGIGDMTLGLGFQDFEAQDDEIIAATLHGIGLGGATLGVGIQMQEDDTSILIHADIGNIYVHYEQVDVDEDSVGQATEDWGRDTTPNMIVLGYTQSLGRKTTAWYEVHSIDADSDDGDDDTTGLYATLKYDIE